jgi:Peptidase inhibitor I78 family
MVRRIVAAAFALTMGACVAAEDPDLKDCGAAGMQGLVAQPAVVLAAMTFPTGTRIIQPGMAVTEDYSLSRLNIDVDISGRISRVWCG